MVKIQIDGTIYEVKAELNLLENCLALGFDIPYFCFHPAMGSIGACRLCAVKKFADPQDKKGRIIMSCMEQVVEGMIISIEDPEVKAFRASVIESLMTNHPHDCPICDEGGECHLQDMTVMTGHNYRRFVFKKRTHTNQDLGPFIQHEMNRCIQCYRCVRYYRNYAGGKDLNVFGSANRVYFGRQKDGILENEFSGNLIEVCPTGVFTDKTLKKHYSRKWDLSNAPSICNHCSLGCNIIISERYGYVRRVMSRYNGSVNGYFLCDRGRFGYEFLNDPGKIEQVHTRSSKESDLLKPEKDNIILRLKQGSGKKVIGIGSPRASLESNYAMLSLVGKDNFFHGISAHEQKLVRKAVNLLRSGIAHVPSLKEVEKCDAVLILGEDITNTSPMLSLAVRQAARNKSIHIAENLGIPWWNDVAAREMDQDLKSPVFTVTPFTTKLDDITCVSLHMPPDDIARLGFAVASLINPGAPKVAGLNESLLDSARIIASGLKEAANPLVVTGISMGSEDILHATANIVRALSESGKTPSVSITFAECNSAGLAIFEGGSLDEAFEMVESSNADTVVILENDLYRRTPKEKVDSLFNKCRQVIVLDHLSNPTAMKADLLLPVASFAESAGTIVNNEGRAQRYYSVLPLKYNIKESWSVISEIMKNSEGLKNTSWNSFDDVVNSMVETYPFFSGLKERMPNSEFRFFNEKIARQTLRFSGRTAMNANISVHEPKPPQDNDSPLNFSMEGYKGSPPAALIPYFWWPGWNSPQAINKYLDEPGGHLKEGGDPGVQIFDVDSNPITGYFKDCPGAFKPGINDFLFLPAYLIFGSEELSSRGEAVSELIPESFIVLNNKEIQRLTLDTNGYCKVVGKHLELKVKIKEDQNIPDGVAGLSYLLPGMPFIELPFHGRIVREIE